MIPDRISRVETLLKKEISNIIQQDLQDPRLEFTSVTEVRVTKDLKEATVWISPLKSNKREKQGSVDALRHARSRVQNLLSKRIVLRYLPKLSFKLDETIEYSTHITKIMDQLKKEEGRSD